MANTVGSLSTNTARKADALFTKKRSYNEFSDPKRKVLLSSHGSIQIDPMLKSIVNEIKRDIKQNKPIYTYQMTVYDDIELKIGELLLGVFTNKKRKSPKSLYFLNKIDDLFKKICNKMSKARTPTIYKFVNKYFMNPYDINVLSSKAKSKLTTEISKYLTLEDFETIDILYKKIGYKTTDKRWNYAYKAGGGKFGERLEKFLKISKVVACIPLYIGLNTIALSALGIGSIIGVVATVGFCISTLFAGCSATIAIWDFLYEKNKDRIENYVDKIPALKEELKWLRDPIRKDLQKLYLEQNPDQNPSNLDLEKYKKFNAAETRKQYTQKENRQIDEIFSSLNTQFLTTYIDNYKLRSYVPDFSNIIEKFKEEFKEKEYNKKIIDITITEDNINEYIRLYYSKRTDLIIENISYINILGLIHRNTSIDFIINYINETATTEKIPEQNDIDIKIKKLLQPVIQRVIESLTDRILAEYIININITNTEEIYNHTINEIISKFESIEINKLYTQEEFKNLINSRIIINKITERIRIIKENDIEQNKLVNITYENFLENPILIQLNTSSNDPDPKEAYTCCICTEWFNKNAPLTKLGCNHVLHMSPCICELLNTQKTPKCPLCVTKISGFSVEEYKNKDNGKCVVIEREKTQQQHLPGTVSENTQASVEQYVDSDRVTPAP